MGKRSNQAGDNAPAAKPRFGRTQKIWHRVTAYAYGPQLFNWRILLALFGAAIYLHFAANPELPWAAWHWRLLAVFISQVALIFGFWASYRFIHFLAPRNKGANAFFVGLAIIGALRGWLLQTLLTWFGVTQAADMGFRILTSAIYLPVLLVALSYLYGVTAEWLESSARLRQSKVDLDELLAYSTYSPEQTQPVLLDSVKAEISMEIELTPVDAGIDDFLRRIVHGVIRPQWNTLLSVTPLPDWRGMVALPQRTTAKLLLSFLTLRNSVHPIAITVAILVSYLPVVINRQGWLPALEFVGLVLALLTPLLFVLRNKVAKKADREVIGKRIYLLTLWLVVMHLPVIFATPFVLGSGFAPVEFAVVAITTSLTTCFVLGLGGALAAENQQHAAELTRISSNIERRAVQVNVRHWYNSRQLARKLQGPVFAEVLGKLRKYSRPQIGDALSDLGTVLGRHRFTARLMQLLATPRLPLEPKPAIDAMLEPWSEFFKLSSTVDSRANRLLINDQAACETVVELAREAVALGVDKSRATMAAVEVEMVTQDTVLVRVTDNGIWAQDPNQLLAASRHFMECALEYRGTRKATGAVIEFTVPVLTAI